MTIEHPIHKTQNKALKALAGVPCLGCGKLCGGTALSRCYLNHRVSFDLDFFLPSPFDPIKFGKEIKQAGIKASVTGITQDPVIANQWHGVFLFGRERLKVSAVEDAYFGVYPAVSKTLGGMQIRTESVEGLYHRKLLTVTHAGGDGTKAIGGRQTARDLFDLWVLSQAVSPLLEFMEALPYDYPREAFKDGLLGMPWFDLIPEMKQIRASKTWERGKDIGVVREHLLSDMELDTKQEISATPGKRPGFSRSGS